MGMLVALTSSFSGAEEWVLDDSMLRSRREKARTAGKG